MEWGQPTNGSAARRHSSQSHGFAVRLWSNLCICSPGGVELVRTILAPDFPLFHGVDTSGSNTKYLRPFCFELCCAQQFLFLESWQNWPKNLKRRSLTVCTRHLSSCSRVVALQPGAGLQRARLPLDVPRHHACNTTRGSHLHTPISDVLIKLQTILQN